MDCIKFCKHQKHIIAERISFRDKSKADELIYAYRMNDKT
jgi:hypothetical protein